MSGSVNKVFIIGNVGADPDVRRTQDGRPIASFNVATSETWRDKATGERKERTQWHRVVVFNEGIAKVVEQYVKKGHKVCIEGQNETRDWTDQGGVKRYVTEVVLRGFNCSLTMLTSGGGNRPPQNDDVDAGGRFTGQGGGSTGGRSVDDEIPF